MARDQANVTLQTTTMHTFHIDLPVGSLDGVNATDIVQVSINGTTPKRLTYRDLGRMLDAKKQLGY